MKTVIVLAIGFWIGRQMYINFDKEQAKQKEERLYQKLSRFFEKQGFSRSEAFAKTQELLKH